MEDDLTAMEERLAHLARSVDDLSDAAARQQREIERLSRMIQLLLGREAEREADEAGTIPLADMRPPHW